MVSQELDYLNNELRLYADIAVPKKHFSEKAVKTDSGDELEKLMEHYSNYREVLNETVLGMEKKNRRLKTVVPVYKRREDYAELHKGAV